MTPAWQQIPQEVCATPNPDDVFGPWFAASGVPWLQIEESKPVKGQIAGMCRPDQIAAL
jgi:hypothetical protein